MEWEEIHIIYQLGFSQNIHDDLDPSGIVVYGDKLVITDGKSYKVRVYRRHDGMLLSTYDTLESRPRGVCCVNDTDLCVAMWDGIITIMSVSDSGLISRGTTFHLTPSFDGCTGVAGFRDNVVVSGEKDKTIYWCVVSLQDGRHDNLHKVCGGRLSWMTTKENMAYIACHADFPDTGVYGFNLLNPSQPPYTYKGLLSPRGITVDDNGHLFVCNYYINNSIHHLTEKCELVAIFKEGIPWNPFAIFWDRGILYLTAFKSNVISMYETPHQDPALPVEILRMDSKSVQLYKKALKDGKEKVYNIRVMVVGQFGVGKSTLIKRLLGQQVDILERKSTEGIDVHKHCCKISLDKGEWIQQLEDSDQMIRLQRLMKILSEPDQEPDGSSEVIYQRDKTKTSGTSTTSVQSSTQMEQDGSREIDATKTSGTSTTTVSDQEVQSSTQISITRGDSTHDVEHLDEETGIAAVPLSDANSNESDKKKDAMMKILHLVNKNAEKLKKDTEKYALLSMWDFAGQYVFYTTHQTFLTRRAVYLLVIDLTQQITDLIKDDHCFLDTDGLKLCKVHDLVEIWLNSIDTCAPSPESSIPVILVGTHVDKLSENARQEIIDKYFPQICRILKDKPASRHMVKFVPIDNTMLGPQFESLKGVIFEMASKQPYWGEEVPTSWLLLEEALMQLKASGRKVIPRSLVEKLNEEASVPVKDAEQLELFLRFQHEIGTILYFSTDRLKEKIVLDPQWFINALKSLITAETFFLEKYPAIRSKWFELKDNGKLTPELIDAVWTRENNPEFYENKEHMLVVMEKLNIIAKPKSYIEDRQEFKENFFIAPCMLCEKTPQEIICPTPHAQTGNSSVLCYVFMDKFLPTPVFHRLVAACIACWPIATQNKQNLLFCGCGVFQLHQNHKLTLYLKEHVIFVRFAKKGIKDKTPSTEQCIRVRELIKTMLNDITGNLGRNLKFEYYIQCPECNGDTVSGLIPVSQLKEYSEVECDFNHIIESHQLLSFWFQDEEQSVDSDASSISPLPAQPTGDTDRFMRITYLLVDVGARVLRQLLRHHTVTSTCTLDQFLNQNKSKIYALPKVFNKPLMAIMFPPNGNDTNLEDYDITLLSALFNNIVPSLSQQEKNLIKKLRDDRNKLFAHAKSCQINASDFQTHWNDISSTLITLSQQCGDTAFEANILQEIQRTKISGIPAGSYIDILKTWFDMIEIVKDDLQNVTSRLQALESKEKSSASES